MEKNKINKAPPLKKNDIRWGKSNLHYTTTPLEN